MNAKRGFTLTEVSITAAIIAAIAAIVWPGYQNWKAQGIMSQAQTELASLAAAELSFKEEYKTFHYHLPAVGFVAHEVQLVNNYPALVGAADGSSVDGKRYYAISITTQGTVASLTTLNLAVPNGLTYDETLGYAANANYCQAAWNGTKSAESTAFGSNLSTLTQTSFTAVTVGCPKAFSATGSTSLDRWTIDDQLNITHVNIQ